MAMIIIAATHAPTVTVVGLAGIASSSGSIHGRRGHFVLSGQDLSSLSAGQLLLNSIVVRMAGSAGLSVLLGASTCRLAARGPQRALTEARHETTALRLHRDRLASERIQRPRADLTRPGGHLARCPGNEANIMMTSGAAARKAFGRNSGACQEALRRCRARVSLAVITMPSRTQAVITRDNVSTKTHLAEPTRCPARYPSKKERR
jgi:hypothetical protein